MPNESSGRERPDIEVGKPRGDAELQGFIQVVSKALMFGDAPHEEWLEREGPENVLVARIDGRVVGGMTVQALGQWFGGRCVPMGGVRAVGVAPEFRAAGVASAMMRASLENMRESGMVLATLYPATQTVYQRAGYEKAGVRRLYRVPTHRIDVRDRTLDIRPVVESDREALETLHRERARRTAGNIDRNAWYWRRLLEPASWMKPIEAYVITRDGKPEGYVITHNTQGFKARENSVQLQDAVANTPAAARRLLTFVADHRSVAHVVTWHGAPSDPLLFHLREQAFEVHDPIDWMLRIVDVPGALKARGYARTLEAELHLDVRDDILAANHGPLVLQVADGSAQITPGGRGDLAIDVRGLAALYSGHLSADELLSTGYIEEGAASEVLATASAIFAGPAPWMSDMF